METTPFTLHQVDKQGKLVPVTVELRKASRSGSLDSPSTPDLLREESLRNVIGILETEARSTMARQRLEKNYGGYSQGAPEIKADEQAYRDELARAKETVSGFTRLTLETILDNYIPNDPRRSYRLAEFLDAMIAPDERFLREYLVFADLLEDRALFHLSAWESSEHILNAVRVSHPDYALEDLTELTGKKLSHFQETLQVAISLYDRLSREKDPVGFNGLLNEQMHRTLHAAPFMNRAIADLLIRSSGVKPLRDVKNFIANRSILANDPDSLGLLEEMLSNDSLALTSGLL